MTDRPELWKGTFVYLADLADAKPSAADYAMTVRKVYDVLVEETGDAATAKEFLLFQVSLQHQRGLVSKQHQKLVTDLFPNPPTRRRGRPKDALGKATYGRKYKLYRDWIYERTFDPTLTKEKFAKKRLGITDEQHNDNDSAHARVHALLQDLKPARMKYLDDDQRRALEALYPLVLTASRQNLAREWRVANQNCPALTKEDFVRNYLKSAGGGTAEDLIREHLEYLKQGEELLADGKCR